MTVLLYIFSTKNSEKIKKSGILLSTDLYPLLLFTLIGMYRPGPLKLAQK